LPGQTPASFCIGWDAARFRIGSEEPAREGRLQKVQLDLSPAPLQLLGAYSHRHSVTARVPALLEFIQARLQGGDPVLVSPSRL